MAKFQENSPALKINGYAPANNDTRQSKSPLCKSKRCQVCQCNEEIAGFQKFDGNKNDIRRGIMNCDTDFTV